MVEREGVAEFEREREKGGGHHWIEKERERVRDQSERRDRGGETRMRDSSIAARASESPSCLCNECLLHFS